MSHSTIDRRRAMVLSAGSALGIGFLSTRSAASSGKSLAARVAHITDVHIDTAKDAPKGVAAMFAHMFARKDKPEIVLNTGDTVMNLAGNVSGTKASEQIALWKDAAKGSPAPIYSCLGNHDIWDGKQPTDEAPATMTGSALMVKALGMSAPWHSFDHGGWHFIALNSVCEWPNYGSLTKEHFTWLREDLKVTKAETPVCVMSHLPILSVTSSVYGDSCKRSNGNLIPAVWQHLDCWAISELFRKHPNVKLCLSGHMHTCDRCEYRGVWYICGGAVSGSWWNGAEYGFPPCYGMISLYSDGEFDYEFVDYGWAAQTWRGKQLIG
jgi:predicted MPP superfamily phosphohydrolase